MKRKRFPLCLFLLTAVLLILTACHATEDKPASGTETSANITHALSSEDTHTDSTDIATSASTDSNYDPATGGCIFGPSPNSLILVRWGKKSDEPLRLYNCLIGTFVDEQGNVSATIPDYAKEDKLYFPFYYRVEVEVLRVYFGSTCYYPVMDYSESKQKSLADITYIYIPAQDISRVTENGYALVWHPECFPANSGFGTTEDIIVLRSTYYRCDKYESAFFLPVEDGKLVMKDLEYSEQANQSVHGNPFVMLLDRNTEMENAAKRTGTDPILFRDGMPLEEFEYFFRHSSYYRDYLP